MIDFLVTYLVSTFEVYLIRSDRLIIGCLDILLVHIWCMVDALIDGTGWCMVDALVYGTR